MTMASPSSTNCFSPDLTRGFDDPGICAGPVAAIAGNQAHAIAIALDAQAIAVILDFVQPILDGKRERAKSRL